MSDILDNLKFIERIYLQSNKIHVGFADIQNAINEIGRLRAELALYKRAPDDKPLVSLPDPTREQHRALVEAGYAPLDEYVKKYGSDT